MTKFNPSTIAKLNRLSANIANELIDGIRIGHIRQHGFGDQKKEIRKFVSMYSKMLSDRFGANVPNILKTPKQLNFLVGSIAYRLRKANVA